MKKKTDLSDNPLFQLKRAGNVVGEVHIKFKPQIDNDYSEIISQILVIEKENKKKMIEEGVASFEENLSLGNAKGVVDSIMVIFQYKNIFIRSLLESSIRLVGSFDQIVVNTVFENCSDDMTATEAYQLCKLIMETLEDITPSESNGYLKYLDALTKTNSEKVANKKKKLEIYSLPEQYNKLSECSKTYWLYPYYIINTTRKVRSGVYEKLPSVGKERARLAGI